MTIGTKNLVREVGVMIATALALLFLLVAITGCSANHAVGEVTQHPGVKAQRNLFSTSVEMTSDGSAKVEKMTYNAKENAIEIEGLSINQKSSEAAKYDAAKIEKIGVAQEWQVHWVRESWSGLTSTLHELAPMLQLLAASKFVPTSSGFNIEVPGYFSVGNNKITDPAQMQAFLQSLAANVTELRQTTTQPAKKEEE